MGVIYQIRNVNNDKVYIGSTLNAEQRKRIHFAELKRNAHKSLHLQNGFNLEPDAFRFEILEECDDAVLLESESDNIHAYCKNGFVDHDLCYNINPNPQRPIHSPETKMKISQAQKGKKRGPMSAEHRRQLSNAKRGTSLNAMHKLAISKAMSGKKKTPVHIEKVRCRHIGRTYPKTNHTCLECGSTFLAYANNGSKPLTCSNKCKQRRHLRKARLFIT